MNHKRQKMHTSENGQSLVELAVTITILMMLLAGTIDFGRAFFTWVALRDAAQEGASYASIDPTNLPEIEERVYDILEKSDTINDPRSAVEVTRNLTGAACLGNTVELIVNYDEFPLTMPFLGTILGTNTLRIHATIQDTILLPACGR